MEIEHLLEKGSGKTNEDCLVIEKNLFGVFDGASSLENRFFEKGATGGMMAATTAGRVFARNHYPLVELGTQANQAIRSGMRAQNVNLEQRHLLWSTSAAVARIHDNCLEWLQTGDALLVVVYKSGSFKVLVEREDHDFETLCLLKDNPCAQSPEFKDMVKKIREEMNQTYGVLNGEPEALDFINTGFLPLDNVDTILLFTDGLQIPSMEPEIKRDQKELVACYRKLGLTGLKNHIRNLEATDPDIRQYPRFKCHDDIAAIAIRL